MFKNTDSLHPGKGLGFDAAEERLHVHFLGGAEEKQEELRSALSPEELDSILDGVLSLRGDDRETWRAGISFADSCLRRKIRVIDQNIDELAEGGSADSPALREALALLCEEEGKFSARFDGAVENAENAGVPQEEIDRFEKTLSGYINLLHSLTAEAGAGDREELKKAMLSRTEELARSYADQGIDAPAVYEEALAAYEKKDFDTALSLFEKIPDYRRSGILIADLCRFHTVNAGNGMEILYFRNRVYLVRHGIVYPVSAKLFNLSSPLSGNTNHAYIIGAYGDRLYYLPWLDSRSISFFSTDGVGRSYAGSYSVYGSIDADSISFLSDDRREILFTAKYDPKRDKKNKMAFFRAHGLTYTKFKAKRKIDFTGWSDLFRFDLMSGKITLLTEGVSGIAEHFDDTAYYYAPRVNASKRKKITGIRPEKALFSIDLASGAKREELSGNGRIAAITPERKIVFTRIDHHSDRNKTIYVKDTLSDSGERILARNVYDIYDVVNGRVFFLVGNDTVRSLCSVKLDGSGYREDVKYTRDVIGRDNDSFYVTAGKDSVSLFRLSIRENSDAAHPVAFGINNDALVLGKLTIRGNYVYFKNDSDILCRVKTDGTAYEELVVNVLKLVNVTDDKIFYLAVDGKDALGNDINSLYGMDPDGANRKKLIFSMTDIVKVNDSQLLYVRDEKLASRRDIYAGVTDPKLNKILNRNYRKFAKRGVTPSGIVDTVRLFDCDTLTSSTVAFVEPYPTALSLKRERKRLLSKKK